jgi:hypothetical protein
VTSGIGRGSVAAPEQQPAVEDVEVGGHVGINASGDYVEALVLHKGQELQRRARWSLLTALPLRN